MSPRAAATAVCAPESTWSSEASGPSTPETRSVGVDQPGTGVLALEAEGERLAAGGQRRALPLGGGLARAQLLEGVVRLRQRGLGRLVLGVQADLAGLEAGDVHLDPLELLLGGLAALACLGDLHREPRDLRAAGVEPGAGRVDLAGQARQPLAPIGRGTLGLRDAPLLGGRGALRRHAAPASACDSASRAASTCRPSSNSSARRARASASICSGSRPESSSSGSGCRCRTRSADSCTSPWKRSRRPLRANQVSWAAAQPRRVERGLLLRRRLLREQRGELGVDLGLTLAQGGLVGDLGGQRLAQVHEVVGHDPQPGVAHLGLDDDGAAGHLRLPAERLELATQLAR